MWAALGVLLLVSVLRDRNLLGWLYALIAAALLFLVPNIAARLNARIEVSRDEVVYRGPLRRTNKRPRASIVGVVRVRLAVLGPRFPHTYLLFLDREGRTVVPIPEEWWSRQDVQRVLDELGLSDQTLPEPLTPAEANNRYPGAASFGLIHRFAIAALVLLIGLIVLGVIVGPSHR